MTRSPSAPSRRPCARGRIHQYSSHADLLVDRSGLVLGVRSRRDVPDAVVVPSSRPAHALGPLIETAAALGTLLVVLCSGRLKVDQVAERLERQLGARGVAARLADDGDPSGLAFGTSDPWFDPASGGRDSDLSPKRNAGLLLARSRDWERIVFVDDDITLQARDLTRMTRLLDESPVVGMRCPAFPDNSVLCHARRLSGRTQDVFVSGSVLGVRCGGRDLPFFPDVYCEDWFFVGEAAATGGLLKAGEAGQAEYDEYAPGRARHEEFGDLLAEGLYSLLHDGERESFDQVVSSSSTRRYWETFIDARRAAVERTRVRLRQLEERPSCSPKVAAAASSLREMEAQYESGAITPDVCLAFLEAWRKDTADWRNALPEPAPRASLADAMARLGAVEWEAVRMNDQGPSRSRSRLSQRPPSSPRAWTSPVGMKPTLV